MKILVTMLVAASLTAPSVVRAQQPDKTALSVSGLPLTFTSPTASDFQAGSVTSSAVTFTVSATTGTTSQRTATVSIRCAAPCPAQGSKPAVTLRWRRADLSSWNPITTSNVTIESRTMFKDAPLPASNDPWSNSIYFQFLLDWLSDPPSSTSNRYDIVLTLTVTVP